MAPACWAHWEGSDRVIRPAAIVRVHHGDVVASGSSYMTMDREWLFLCVAIVTK